MMRRDRFLLIVWGVCFLVAAPALAHHERERHRGSEPGWGRHGGPLLNGYVEFEAGSTLIPDQDVRGAVDDGKIDLESGFTVGGSAGLRFSPFFRVEGSLGYRRAEVDNLEFDEPFLSDSRGDVGVFSTLANAYLDLPIPNSPATPFLGVGLGFAVVDIDTYDRFDAVNINDTSVQFAWNVTSGVAWAITQNLDIVTRYRYFATEDASEDASGSATLPGSADIDFESHEAVLGLRFTF